MPATAEVTLNENGELTITFMFKKSFIFMCVSVLYACMFVQCLQKPEELLDPLELE